MSHPLAALAVRPARPRGKEAVLLGFEPPRTTVLAFVPAAPPATLSRALRRLIAPDALVILPIGADLPAFRSALAPARVLSSSPAEVLRFLWYYRDEHEMLALGHASERPLLAERFLARRYPGFRAAADRRAVHGLLREAAAVLGVRLPRPDERHRGPAADAAYLETALNLLAALLLEFAAPLARVAGDRLFLADRWLASRISATATPFLPPGRPAR